MLIEFLLFLVTGLLAGIAAGLLGIGGGIVVVPCLAFIFAHIGIDFSIAMHMAISTSLATMVFTALASIYSHHHRNAVLWHLFWQLLPGIVIGTILGTILGAFLSTTVLKIIFAIFLLFIAANMFLLIKPKPKRQLPGQGVLTSIATLIGLKSGLLGIGGGAITVPFLIWCNVPMHQASGTSAACTLPIAIVGTICTIITGWGVSVNHLALGYVYWPAAFTVAIASIIAVFIGGGLAQRLPVNVIKRIFAGMLVIAAVNLLR